MAGWKQQITVIMQVSILIIGLAGCGTAPTTQIFNAFEKASTAEADVAAMMQTLSTLEGKDSKQYNYILSQGKQDNRNVQTLINNASKILEERQQIMERLQVMLDGAYKKMGKLDDTIRKLQGESLREQATDAYNAYRKRFEAFTLLHRQHKQLIGAEQTLYGEMKQANSSPKKVRAAISKRNEVYRQVEQLKTQFNNYTKQFNSVKFLFYKQAGFQFTKYDKMDGNNVK